MPPPARETQDGWTRNLHEKIPPARNSGPQKIPPKYQKNTPEIPKMRIFSGIFSGLRISGQELFFQYFSRKFRVRPSRVSLVGGGILNNKV